MKKRPEDDTIALIAIVVIVFIMVSVTFVKDELGRTSTPATPACIEVVETYSA